PGLPSSTVTTTGSCRDRSPAARTGAGLAASSVAASIAGKNGILDRLRRLLRMGRPPVSRATVLQLRLISNLASTNRTDGMKQGESVMPALVAGIHVLLDPGL